jgi:hypothetical protein
MAVKPLLRLESNKPTNTTSVAVRDEAVPSGHDRGVARLRSFASLRMTPAARQRMRLGEDGIKDEN